MEAIYKATKWRLKGFLGAIATGLLASGMVLPTILWSRYAIAQPGFLTSFANRQVGASLSLFPNLYQA
jgi:hypothetical protein